MGLKGVGQLETIDGMHEGDVCGHIRPYKEMGVDNGMLF